MFVSGLRRSAERTHIPRESRRGEQLAGAASVWGLFRSGFSKGSRISSSLCPLIGPSFNLCGHRRGVQVRIGIGETRNFEVYLVEHSMPPDRLMMVVIRLLRLLVGGASWFLI